MQSFITSRRFLPLFVTQFLGAFNDNLLKNAMVVLVTYRLAQAQGYDAQMLVTVAAGLFILPFFLFSATAGRLADGIDRARLARGVKLAEIAIMAVAAAGFYGQSLVLLFLALFLMGLHSTFFGPVKYALLPQHLAETELLAGNAWVEAGTFLAILLGTILGGLLILHPAGEHLVCGLLLAVAVAGYGSSRCIPAAPTRGGWRPRWNIFAETIRIMHEARADKLLWNVICAISWFWLVGATFLSQFPPYAQTLLRADATVVTLFLTLFSLGIGLGSLLSNRLLKGEITTRAVLPAMVGLSLALMDFTLASYLYQPAGEGLVNTADFIAQWQGLHICLGLLAVAVCAGVYIVPLYAMLQHRSAPKARARMVAANNILNALYMVVSALLVLALAGAGVGIGGIFAWLAGGNLLAMLWLRTRLGRAN